MEGEETVGAERVSRVRLSGWVALMSPASALLSTVTAIILVVLTLRQVDIIESERNAMYRGITYQAQIDATTGLVQAATDVARAADGVVLALEAVKLTSVEALKEVMPPVEEALRKFTEAEDRDWKALTEASLLAPASLIEGYNTVQRAFMTFRQECILNALQQIDTWAKGGGGDLPGVRATCGDRSYEIHGLILDYVSEARATFGFDPLSEETMRRILTPPE